MAEHRYYMNPLAKFFLVLLRVAIGWHLCYEGMAKLWPEWGAKPFSAEMYLRTAGGPWRQQFRSLVDDFYGFEKLDLSTVKAGWEAMVNEIGAQSGFSAEQQAAAAELLKKRLAALEAHLESPATRQKIADYRKASEAWEAADRRETSHFEKLTHAESQRELDATRRELVGPVEAIASGLAADLDALRTENQKKLPARSWDVRKPTLDQINAISAYGLLILGGCLLLGLFSRLSALGAAALVMTFYLAHPPWPGELPNPLAEGSYLIVNKNLIEVVACLLLATTPSGVWAGLDAIVRGAFTRPWFGVGAQEVQPKGGV